MDVVIKSSIKNVYKNVLGNNFIFFIFNPLLCAHRWIQLSFAGCSLIDILWQLQLIADALHRDNTVELQFFPQIFHIDIHNTVKRAFLLTPDPV